ncbi:hypothetical protein [Mangrovicoccus ximenensis]|uniref:hypothetical protein n=1 Tax=Mangrovicoccus ximenensis TaxID=1911570 RepID=UPI000D380F4D|nr:hypothetical protein [Mangrovicoccus ximenensis]
MKRRTFGEVFKVEAVRLVQERGLAAVLASRELDVAKSMPPSLRDISAGLSMCLQAAASSGHRNSVPVFESVGISTAIWRAAACAFRGHPVRHSEAGRHLPVQLRQAPRCVARS